jgi:ubiquinone/menaquinone biosynthesis C-methylase UbiE
VTNYEDRVGQELAGYDEVEEVHQLPPIYHFWSQRHVLPLLHEVGLESLDGWWDDAVAEVCAARAPRSARLVSLGAGNGDLETAMAARLAERGIDNLEIELLELNPAMLERARSHAERLGVGDRLTVRAVDLNSWEATEPADAYLACHSLHHVVELEHLFDEVARTLAPDGVLLVNDMVGRNGHRRWPEAAGIVHGLWRNASPRRRHNNYTGVEDAEYPDHDCSTEGFEGVRAQDVLPLLLDRFHPEVYITFANVIDPFVDRVYGPNFDPDDEQDRRFIETVAALDDAAIDLHLITPTHLVATFRNRPVACRYPRDRSPARTLRRPDDPARMSATPPPAQPVAAVAGAGPGPAADEGWRRYEALRARKVVRLGLALARLRRRP